MWMKNNKKGVKLFWDKAIEAREARAQMQRLIFVLVKATPSKNILLAKAKPSKRNSNAAVRHVRHSGMSNDR